MPTGSLRTSRRCAPTRTCPASSARWSRTRSSRPSPISWWSGRCSSRPRRAWSRVRPSGRSSGSPWRPPSRCSPAARGRPRCGWPTSRRSSWRRRPPCRRPSTRSLPADLDVRLSDFAGQGATDGVLHQVHLVDLLAWLAPLLGVLLLATAGSVIPAPGRVRRAVRYVGRGSAVAGGVLGLLLVAVGFLVGRADTATLSGAVAQAGWSELSGAFWTSVGVLTVAGAAIALAARPETDLAPRSLLRGATTWIVDPGPEPWPRLGRAATLLLLGLALVLQPLAVVRIVLAVAGAALALLAVMALVAAVGDLVRSRPAPVSTPAPSPAPHPGRRCRSARPGDRGGRRRPAGRRRPRLRTRLRQRRHGVQRSRRAVRPDLRPGRLPGDPQLDVRRRPAGLVLRGATGQHHQPARPRRPRAADRQLVRPGDGTPGCHRQLRREPRSGHRRGPRVLRRCRGHAARCGCATPRT